jgi:hypothetical protein
MNKTNQNESGPDPAFAAAPSSPCGSRPSGLQSGVEPFRLLDDPAGQAAFMLPRLNDAQREFITRMKPHTRSQRVSQRDYDRVWPGVETGVDWPWQFWFGGLRAYFPAGRLPLGNKRCSYSFCFSEAGLLVRDALAAGSGTAETGETPAQCEASQSGAKRNAQRTASHD